MTILDPDRSRIVSIDFIDNPYHGEHYAEEGELCSMPPKDGTTTCHRYCTAYVVSNEKPVTLAMTYVRNDQDEDDAFEHKYVAHGESEYADEEVRVNTCESHASRGGGSRRIKAAPKTSSRSISEDSNFGNVSAATPGDEAFKIVLEPA
jgi:hypothetical protein